MLLTPTLDSTPVGMHPNLSPVVAGLSALLVFLFFVLILTWCCRHCSSTKQSEVSLIPHSVSPQRYISTIDVQTGMPVVIDVTAISPGSRARNIALPPRRLSTPAAITVRRPTTTLYGTMGNSGNEQETRVSRSPPPPYSEVCTLSAPVPLNGVGFPNR